MTLTAETIAQRAPVWRALSELYLDNELSDMDVESIVETCAASGYSPAELDQIMFEELYPVLSPNISGFIGEWAGFDQEWLRDQIVALRPSFHLPWRLSPWKRMLFHSRWPQVQEGIALIRSGKTAFPA